MRKPYVGITGASTPEEARFISGEFCKNGYSLGSDHIGMLGILVSQKTLEGKKTSNRRYPPFGDVSEILQSAGRDVFPVIHYNTKDDGTLAGQISQVFRGIYDEGLCRAVQLNIAWPRKKQVREILKKFPEMDIILQASYKAMEGRTPAEIAEEAASYGKCISYVLIDPSGGRGAPFDLSHSLSVYSKLDEALPGTAKGFAGGLNGKNVAGRVLDLAAVIGDANFSIDAEGGLRDMMSREYGDDVLNRDKVSLYLKNSSLAFG